MARTFGNWFMRRRLTIAVVVGTLGLVLGTYAVKVNIDQGNQQNADRILVDFKNCQSGNMTRTQLRQFFKRIIVQIPDMSGEEKAKFFEQIDEGLPNRDCSEVVKPNGDTSVTVPSDDGISPNDPPSTGG